MLSVGIHYNRETKSLSEWGEKKYLYVLNFELRMTSVFVLGILVFKKFC